jgi:C1A family cysteine protease
MPGTGGYPTGPIIGTNSTPPSPRRRRNYRKKWICAITVHGSKTRQLGSCTANALVGNLEFLEKKAGHTVTDLSRLFVYYNERAMEGTINDDAGAMIRDGVKTLVKLGVCSEKKWPYKTAKFTNKPPAACYKEASDHQITSYHRIISLQQMRHEGYPFVFGFSVYEAQRKTTGRPRRDGRGL